MRNSWLRNVYTMYYYDVTNQNAYCMHANVAGHNSSAQCRGNLVIPSGSSLVMADRRVLLLLSVLAVSTHAFYLPGLAPTNFCRQQVKDEDKNANCKVSVCHPLSPRLHTMEILMYVLTPVSISFFSPPGGCICTRQQAWLDRNHRPLWIFQVMPTMSMNTSTLNY